MGGNVKQFLEELRKGDPEIQAEYDRLGPRYEIISRLIAARRAVGLSQAALATRMGVKQPVVARLESGENSPRLDTLLAAAEAMGYALAVEFKPGAGLVKQDAPEAPVEPVFVRRPRARKATRVEV